jgi:hypothetical protein
MDMDVRLPNGRIIKDVPEGTSKDEVRRKAVAAGLIADSDFPRESTPTPIRDEGYRFYQNTPQPPAPEQGPVARESVPSEQSVEPYTEPTMLERARGKVSAIANEARRSVYGGAITPAVQSLLSLNNAVRDTLGFEATPEEKGKQQALVAAGLSIITADTTRKNSFISMNDQGQVEYDRPETFVGTIAPYVVAVPAGFSWVAGSTLLKGLSAASRITIASVASDVGVNQLITDPHADNLIDVLEDMFPGDSGLKTLTAYLSTEEEDPEVVRRIKMAGQDALLSSMFAGSATLYGMLRRINTPEAKKALDQGVAKLVQNEKGELVYRMVREIKEDARKVVEPVLENGRPVYRDGRPVVQQVKDENGNPLWRSYQRPDGATVWNSYEGEVANPAGATPARGTTSLTLADDELRQIEQQTGSTFSGAWNRLWNQTFTSRGYWTKTLFDMSQKSQSEQRALISEASHVATRLNTSIDRMARQLASTSGGSVEDATNTLMEKVHKAFTSGNRTDIAALPDDVRTEVVTARAMIDGLTQRMIDSPAVYEEFKKTLIDGQGKYLRRSYEAYTNPSYVPSPTARSEAVDFLTNENMAQGMPFEEAAKLAEGRVVALLERDGRGLDAYINDAVKVNTSVFSQRKDVPEELRKLLGEIVNPGDNVIQSARKLVGFVQADQFSRDLLEVGDGKFLFDSPQGIYTTPITGTNTILDVVEQGTEAAMPGQALGRGRYTTPEMARAISGTQVSFVSPSADDIFSKGLRAFIGWKGMSQSAKTIYSHTTHFKNLLGATMMRAANGSNPVGSATKAWRAVSNEIGGGVDAAAQKVYEDYLRLGIINTDVRLGDISEMMKTALDNPNGLGDWFVRKADEFNSTVGKVADTAVNTPRAVYMGTDDFFKIGEFEDYYATLKEAFPNEPDEVLRQRAAKVVRDVLPNYDLVPNAIKQLRTLPFGNFVGFPSEVVRTSNNIIKLGFEELSSGNPVLYARGLRRLTAFTAFGGAGTEGLSDLTKTLAGLSSPEEQRAVDVISRTPWSQDPTVFVVRDAETGELYKADTNSLDPYDFFRAPAKAALRQVQEGTMTKQELDVMLMESSAAFFSAALKPFLSEAIVTEALINAWVGLSSESGETRSGSSLSSYGMSGADSTASTIGLFWETIEPGFVTSARRFADAYLNKYERYTGLPTDPQLAAINQLGLTWGKLSLDKHIEFVAGDYLGVVENSVTLGVDYRSTPEDIISRYVNINKDRYEAQRILYEQTEAANVLGLDTLKIRNILEDRGLDKETVWGIATGQFYPTPISDDTLSKIRDQVYAEGNNHSMSYEQLVSELRRTRASIENNSLMTFEDTTPWRKPSEEGEALLKEGPITRLLKARGGVVRVPNAPALPSTRRDKYTGLPYDVQAGGSYVEEDPLARLFGRRGFAGGGLVTGRALAACNKVLGGGV